MRRQFRVRLAVDTVYPWLWYCQVLAICGLELRRTSHRLTNILPIMEECSPHVDTAPLLPFQQLCQFLGFPLFRQVNNTIAHSVGTNKNFADVAVELTNALANALIDAAAAAATAVARAAFVLAAVVHAAIVRIRLGTRADAAVAHAAITHTAVVHARLCLKRFAAD